MLLAYFRNYSKMQLPLKRGRVRRGSRGGLALPHAGVAIIETCHKCCR